MWLPFSLAETYRRFRGTRCLHIPLRNVYVFIFQNYTVLHNHPVKPQSSLALTHNARPGAPEGSLSTPPICLEGVIRPREDFAFIYLTMASLENTILCIYVLLMYYCMYLMYLLLQLLYTYADLYICLFVYYLRIYLHPSFYLMYLSNLSNVTQIFLNLTEHSAMRVASGSMTPQILKLYSSNALSWR